MNPSAPVTRTLRAAQGHVATPRAAASCSRCPTSIQSSSISNAPTGSPPASRSAMRSGVSTPSARADPSHDRRVEHVDPAVDLALDGRLLVERGHPVAVALDAAERHGVEVPPHADRRPIAAGAWASSSPPTSAGVTRSPFITRTGSVGGSGSSPSAPAVPSGSSSRRYSIRAPSRGRRRSAPR